MTEQKTTTLALPAAPAPPTRSLIADLAAAAGVEPAKFYAAVKVAAGCSKAEDPHYLVLLMQAQKYGLDPLAAPPQLQLLDVGQGPQVYARLDAYKSFLHRAEDAGVLSDRSYEEGWFLDPRVDPAKKQMRRGGRVRGTITKLGKPRVVEKIVWLDEWMGGEKSQWPRRSSHMLEARAWKEFCRDNLGYFLYDTDDAERIGADAARRVDVVVTDAAPLAPAIPIPGLTRAGATDAAGKDAVTAGPAILSEGGLLPNRDDAPGSAPAASPPRSDLFDSEESRRLDAEIAET